MTKDQNADARDTAVRSIVKQWNGGERKLAGARASELVYGAGNKLDEKLLEQIKADAQGIEQFIVPPSAAPVTQVADESGDPNSPQPEAREKSDGASNASGDDAKDEQDAVDEVLEPGREQRTGEGADEIGSTKLNPEGSDQDPKGDGKPAKRKAPAKRAAK